MVDEKRLCIEGIEMQQKITLPHVKTTKTHTSWGEMLRHWPKTTFCIVSNEFCERFSYYGMRKIPQI
ncbi:unnamed protein product [Haemonchus placei]|uniref:Transposase n=1 Tax=Haemonchus placei TaxID=6290 RepID=A0A0N4WTP5_HAEPC|nr:unnamed protein product [Haemonchus placei]